MAKEDGFSLENRVLGTVVKVIKTSGMLELNSGEKIPPFPGVEVGDKVELKNKRYFVVGKESANSGVKEEKLDLEALKKENKALKAKQAKQEKRLKALEEASGEKGEKINPAKEGEKEGEGGDNES